MSHKALITIKGYCIMIILTQQQEIEVLSCEEIEVRHNQLVEQYSKAYIEKLFFMGLSSVFGLALLCVIIFWLADRESLKEKVRRKSR